MVRCLCSPIFRLELTSDVFQVKEPLPTISPGGRVVRGQAVLIGKRERSPSPTPNKRVHTPDASDDSDASSELSFENDTDPMAGLSEFEQRQQHVSSARERIALLAAAILEDPAANVRLDLYSEENRSLTNMRC
jgi:hypothetical protein